MRYFSLDYVLFSFVLTFDSRSSLMTKKYLFLLLIIDVAMCAPTLLRLGRNCNTCLPIISLSLDGRPSEEIAGMLTLNNRSILNIGRSSAISQIITLDHRLSYVDSFTFPVSHGSSQLAIGSRSRVTIHFGSVAVIRSNTSPQWLAVNITRNEFAVLCHSESLATVRIDDRIIGSISLMNTSRSVMSMNQVSLTNAANGDLLTVSGSILNDILRAMSEEEISPVEGSPNLYTNCRDPPTSLDLRLDIVSGTNQSSTIVIRASDYLVLLPGRDRCYLAIQAHSSSDIYVNLLGIPGINTRISSDGFLDFCDSIYA